MTYTITLGWWLVPALITLITFGVATVVVVREEPDTSGVASIFGLVLYMAAALVSLVAWLIWALV